MENNKTQTNNKQIMKNAISLYLRMFITLIIGLFTSRVILRTLGVEDYGIYNVVGSFVSMFSLISGTLRGAVSRFLTFALGKGDIIHLRIVFSTALYVMIGLSIIIFFASETFGIWYLYHKMVIPAARLNISFWVFQISLCTFILSLICTPFNASILSHEHMHIYAYLAIFSSVSKLMICYLLNITIFDKLLFYSILLFIVTVVEQLFSFLYCKLYFPECTIKLFFDWKLFKEIFSFAGWDFFGSSASICRLQGTNLMLNAFGGPIVNTAYGIANTLSGVVGTFVGNFTSAFKPQIVKRYANKEYESLMKLIILGSKYSFFIMLFMVLPISLNVHFLLKLWLDNVPDHTVILTYWTLLIIMSDCIVRPIITARDATGDIRNYQLVVGTFLLLILPISYLFLKNGAPVETVAAIGAIISVLAIFVRMLMLREAFPTWSSSMYMKEVIICSCKVSIISSIIPVCLAFIMKEGWMRFLVTSSTSVITTAFSILFIGNNKDERNIIINKIISIIQSKLK